MSSRRMPFDPTTKMGAKIAQLIAYGVAYRAAASELNLECAAYVDDMTSLETDTGISSGNIANFLALLNQSANEVSATLIGALAQGAQTGTRQLLDEMGGYGN